jgi:hypothetical protein
MDTLKNSIINLLLTCMLVSCDSQKPAANMKIENYYEKCRSLVLSENKPYEEYVFKVMKKEIIELHATYLGSIKTVKGDTLKFLNSINYFGLYEDSKRANGAVILYNEDDRFLGMYQVGNANSVAAKIEGTNLVFDYNNGNCNQITLISFKDSIPKQIFVNCTKEGGDLYTFTQE